MEFDSNFATIQAVLKNQDKIHGGLQNIQSGHDSKLKCIKTKLSEAIEDESMKKDDLRRVYLLLLLNTDHDCLNDLYNDPNYVHILGSIPKLSKHLFIEIVNHLKLDQFLYESILFLPPALSTEVVEIYLNLLKTRDPFQLLKYIDFISRALFIKLVMLRDNNDENLFKAKLKYFEYLHSVTERLNSSKIDDYKAWEQNKLYFLSACIMKSITSIVKTCCEYFIRPVVTKEDFLSIYDISLKKEFNKQVKIETNVTGDDLLKNCLQLILSKFLTAAQSITVLTWMSWMELDEYTEENLQSVVGNEVYYCLNYIKDEKIKSCINSHLYSELVAVLTNLSIKPFNEDDEIKSASLQTILSNIKNPLKNQAKWLSAFISREDFIPDLINLNVINEHVHLFNQKDSEIFLEKCVKFLQNSTDNSEKDNNETNGRIKHLLKQIFLTSLENFHVDNQITLLELFVQKYGLTDVLKVPEFDSQLTEIFNKVIDKDNQTDYDFYSNLISVSFQSPETVVRKTLKEALSSTQHGKLMVDLLKVLKPICLFKPAATEKSILHMITVDMLMKIDVLSDTEKDNFAALVTKLINKSLIDKNQFLIKCLIPFLYESIQLKKWQLVILLLEVLKSFTDCLGADDNDDDDLEVKLPVIVIFLGQLMDKTRCTLSNFNVQSNAVCDKALEVLITVLEIFDADEQEISAMNWLKQEMQKLNIITQLHILSYVNTPILNELISKNSIEVYWLQLLLCGSDKDLSFLNDMRRDSFLRTLSKLLPGFTTREWKIMFANLVPREEVELLFDLFLATGDAVLFLEAAVVPHITKSNVSDDKVDSDFSDHQTSQDTSTSATGCLCFIIKNLITVVQDVLFPHVKKMTCEQLAEIFIKICKVLHEFPEATTTYTWILLKVLQDLLTFAELSKINKDGKSTVVQINKFCAGIGLIPNIELRQNLSKAIMTKIND